MNTHTVRADEVRVGDMLATPGQKPRIVAQIRNRRDDIEFVHGLHTTTTCPARSKVHVLRAEARVEDHDAAEAVHTDNPGPPTWKAPF